MRRLQREFANYLPHVWVMTNIFVILFMISQSFEPHPYERIFDPDPSLDRSTQPIRDARGPHSLNSLLDQGQSFEDIRFDDFHSELSSPILD